MGTYTTTTAIDINMIGVTFDTVTTNMVDKAIDDAEAKVNSYLGNRYDLGSDTFQTATSIPPMVRTLTEMYAEGLSWTRNTRGAGADFERGKEMRQEALDCLQSIRKYELNIFDTSGSIIPEKGTSNFRIQSSNSTYTPTFGEDDELNWAVDEDKLQDISDDRD